MATYNACSKLTDYDQNEPVHNVSIFLEAMYKSKSILFLQM